MATSRPAGRWAVLAFLVATPLLLLNTGGHAIHNGDEAIYAQVAREMVESGHAGTMTWQGARQFPRPPGVAWILAGAHRLLGDERAVRWPLAAAAGAQVALVLLLGATLYGLGVGLAAAGALLTFDLFIGYARFLESEPFLTAFIVAAFLCWFRRRYVAWGLLLGCALMIKQVVGALPLLALVVDRLGRPDADRARARDVGRGLLAAAAVWLPWHLWAVLTFGREFLEPYVVGNLIDRSRAVILHATRPSYYLRELWRSEGAFALVAAAGVALVAVRAARRRGRPDLLVATWALAPFVLFSLSASRFDYYVLVAYPALALATGALLFALPVRPPLRVAIAALCVAAAGLAHLPRNLSAFDGEDEVRALVRVADQALDPPARLYLFNTHPYAARYYSELQVTTLVDSAEDYRLGQAQARTGLPVALEHTPALAADLRRRPGPFALLMPRARANLLNDVPLRLIGQTRRWLLLRKD